MLDRRVTYDEACRLFGVSVSDEEIYQWFIPREEEVNGRFVSFDGDWPRPVVRDFDLVRLSDFKRFLELRNDEHR
ncbi:hypothetical protein [Bifidobacterium scaligerum]|uniref:Uncharacterized protein n=1 Tax=Bifidobacterium scaligerum TaxID=2052656 RepID=A0A2M9HP05_9BIFI|nr:hypothetical protein [Bifidobacterium scaligerum]PJM78552.1 hypothetical protein CUU80_08895 [Bifidobacterium scaligerum]